MIVVYVIIVTSIVNLSLQNGKNELWITLLSSAIGYALPSPTLLVNAETVQDLFRRVFDVYVLDGLQ
jgi:FtsH-binding integral membrane protein